MNPQNHLEHFESLVPRFDVQRKKQRYYYSLLLNRLKYLVPPNQSILELGCADGEQMMSLKPSSAMGIDFSPGFLRLARERYPQGRWIQADLTQPLPSIPPAFDYVIGTDILGYLQDIQGAMENVANICGPETRLVLTKSNPFWGPLFRLASYVGLAEPRRYSNWLSQKQSADILELAGFEVVQSGKFCLLPIEIPFVSTFFNRFLAHLPLINSLCLVEYLVCRKKPAPAEAHPSVTVIIPARNEKGNILPALQRMPRFPGALEVLFVEGNSADGTWEEIQRVMSSQSWPFEVRAYKQTGKGKGDAVRVGFNEAKNDLLMILDADLTVMPEELPRFYQILADRRAEYVHGTRLVYPMENQAMRPLNWLGNKFFSWAFSFLLGQNLSDTLCGTKCLWRKKYLELAEGRSYFGDFDPFGDFDLIFGAAKLNLKISEIPVHYKSRTYGETQINRFRDGWLLLQMCWFAARKMYFL
jgi:ubiquinone/menaquinone biosynthesis C-methylase UbiE